MQNPHEFRKTPHLKWTKIQAIHIIILIFFHPSPPFCRRNLKESGCDSFESYVSKMERPGTWGSQLELMAICQSYGVLLG